MPKALVQIIRSTIGRLSPTNLFHQLLPLPRRSQLRVIKWRFQTLVTKVLLQRLPILRVGTKIITFPLIGRLIWHSWAIIFGRWVDGTFHRRSEILGRSTPRTKTRASSTPSDVKIRCCICTPAVAVNARTGGEPRASRTSLNRPYSGRKSRPHWSMQCASSITRNAGRTERRTWSSLLLRTKNRSGAA